jgi:hypothetical protein
MRPLHAALLSLVAASASGIAWGQDAPPAADPPPPQYGSPPPPQYPPQYGYPPPPQYGVPPPRPPLEKRRERRDVVIGAGLLGIAQVHWIDKPSDRAVSVGGLTGRDDTYPGFFGGDLGWGVMIDVRFFELVGVELDVLKQTDRGSGTIEITGGGIPCIIRNNGASTTAPSHAYDLTIGQPAWHVPVLAKLSIPTSRDTRRNDKEEVEYVASWTTLAIGPELVFPGADGLVVSPGGLDYPQRQTASTYVMYTAALGFEKRLASSFDLRLVGSLRGSYNPGTGASADGRAHYQAVGATVQPVEYVSEWRYQLGATLGLGVFF